MKPGDRERIAEALQDETKPFRAIARELGVSDWVVRRVHREVSGDDRPMRGARTRDDPPEDAAAGSSWLALGCLIVGVVVLIWIGARRMPPPEL